MKLDLSKLKLETLIDILHSEYEDAELSSVRIFIVGSAPRMQYTVISPARKLELSVCADSEIKAWRYAAQRMLASDGAGVN
jgi:hypothetical protein